MIYIVILVHWIADFIMQTDAQAKGKSSSNIWLGKHILTYTGCLMIFGPKYALVNGAIHFVVDYFSSRLSSKMYKAGRIHDFFVVIGADQAIHMATLIATMSLIWRF